MFESAYLRAICASLPRRTGLAGSASRIDRKSISRAARSREIIRSTISETIRGSARGRDGEHGETFPNLLPAARKLSGASWKTARVPAHANPLFQERSPSPRPSRSAWNNFLNLLPSSIRTCVSQSVASARKTTRSTFSRTLPALAILPCPCVLSSMLSTCRFASVCDSSS
jgi:hypothetical protein